MAQILELILTKRMNENMNMEYTKKMFVGEILIVDDQVYEEYTEAYVMADYLKKQGFSVIEKETFPVENELAGHKLSMVICDWMLLKGNEEGNAQAVISFLNKVQSKEFIPIFICTSIDRNAMEKYLTDSKYNCKNYKANAASSIIIVKKEDIKNEKLFDFLKEWLLKNPSVKLLKEWEKSLEIAKNNMFNELYNASEYWPWVLARIYKEDGEKNIGESMGEFITKNLLSRISEYYIEDVIPEDNVNIDVATVLEGERCFYYQNNMVTDQTAFKTGDILKKEDELYIVVKRQCDLNRTQNDNLYVLKITELKNVGVEPIFVSEDGKTIHIFDKEYPLGDTNINKINEINKQLRVAFSKTRVLHNGKILEINSQVIIPCVCGKKVISIDLKELVLIEFKDIEQYERTARLLEPYISIVTDKFASYMSSKGSMRTPPELFTKKYFMDETEEVD